MSPSFTELSVSEKVFLIRCATNTFRWRKWDSEAFDSPQFWAWAGNLDLIKTEVKSVYFSRRDDVFAAIELATWNMHAGIVECLLSNNPNFPSTFTFRCVLPLAVETGDVMVLKLLHRKCGPSFDNSLSDVGTCMHWAAGFGHVDVVKTLKREIGVGTEAQNRFGQTPMHWAARYGYSLVIEVLCNLGANLSCRDDQGSFPVHYAAESGEVAALKMLISKGAYVKISNESKQTPLHFAVRSREQNVEVLGVLREAGADVRAEDEEKRTPFDWAVSYGNKAAIEFFEKEGFMGGSIEGQSSEIMANKK
jgi:ankyrin repeat protein